MPGFTCCVPGCYNNSHRDRELRFYTFPKNASQREIWLKNISRAGVSGCFSTFQPTTGHRVCSVHFPGGRKTYTIRVPTLFPLRGVNERRSRRGRGRKAFAASAPAPAPILTSVGAIHGDAQGESEFVVQIGQNGEYISPLTAVSSSSSSSSSTTSPSLTAAAPPADSSCSYSALKSEEVVVAVLPDHPEELLALYGEEHSYSLSNGTTSAELLRKLNEQRDIIALMEVKMKEMKNTIRQLRVNEARLQEELRERERQLSGNGAVRKKV
ncbi:THAP domain-containing protein 11 [Bagarius yarrelli]|uniref:THAP domain-containing protein 11 n=1 Tax=Bagarius yarrelli TaxID=175774 RepID=A0A556VCM9_BAGYA|nr:THAP domain-containing protein 11 [Bagarius yarrelli]